MVCLSSNDELLGGCASVLPVFEGQPWSETVFMPAAVVPPSAAVVPWKPANRVWLCFLGLPGTGKTTRIGVLRDRCSAPVFHMGAFARHKEFVSHSRDHGALIEGLDDAFLEVVAGNRSSLVILDGFPRSVAQLDLLERAAAVAGAQLAFVILEFAGLSFVAQMRASEHRQAVRDSRSNRPLDVVRYRGKIERAMSHDLVVVEHVRARALASVTVDASCDGHVADRQVSVFVEALTKPPGWPVKALEVLCAAAERSGVSAWLTSGGVYRSFWNGRYGPLQEPMDLDVVVAAAEDVDALVVELTSSADCFDWSVFSWDEHVRASYADVSSLPEGFASRVLTYRQGLVRIHDGVVDARLTVAGANDLLSGSVRFDEASLARLGSRERRYHIDKSLGVLPKLLAEYPGLSLAGSVADIYSRSHRPVLVVSTWGEIEREVLALEAAGRPLWDSYEWSCKQLAAAERVARFYRTAPREPSAPRVLRAGGMPVLLELAKPAVDSGSWFELLARSCPDREFRSWVVNQVRSRSPWGGREPDLLSVLDLSRFSGDARVRDVSGVQKPTHMGWSLSMHLRQSLLLLDTDWLAGVVPSSVVADLRLGLRTAVLFHDVGKLVDVFTPGVHEGAGAALFLAHGYQWMDGPVASVAAHLVRHHDILGRVARGLTEKVGCGLDEPGFDVSAPPSYGGAVDPRRAAGAVSELSMLAGISFDVALRMVQEVWRADVGSVAALRWLLPVTEDLGSLVGAAQAAMFR